MLSAAAIVAAVSVWAISIEAASIKMDTSSATTKFMDEYQR